MIYVLTPSIHPALFWPPLLLLILSPVTKIQHVKQSQLNGQQTRSVVIGGGNLAELEPLPLAIHLTFNYLFPQNWIEIKLCTQWKHAAIYPFNYPGLL